MQVARRVYLYLISFISLVMVLSGASNLMRLLLERLFGLSPVDIGFYTGDYWRDQFSQYGAMLVVGAIVWSIHWLLVQRSVNPSNPNAVEERGSALRKLFIYAALATTLMQAAAAVARMIAALLRPAASQQNEPLGLALTAAIPQLVAYGLAWAYYWYVRNSDNTAVPEEGHSATLRRWYFYLVSFVALAIAMFQTSGLATDIWNFVTDPTHPWSPDSQWVPPTVANAVAWILVAGAVWILHWTAIQRRTAVSDDEQHSPLRKVYLYGMTLLTVGVTLGGISFLLYDLLRFVWGTNPVEGSGQSILTAAGGPLMSALVFGVFWAYHWQVLKWDASLVVTELPLQAAIRQLYHYLVALVGLGMLAAGVVNMLRLLFDQWLGGPDILSMSQQEWGDQLSFVATTILIGGAVWLLNWFIVQREAMAVDGDVARHALPRRLYLFLILLATVTSLLGSAAWLIYHVLRYFGEPVGSWVGSASWALAGTITAAVLLAYHLYILVGDQRARAASLAALPAAPPLPTPSPATLLLLRGGDASAIESAVAAFQGQLPEGINSELFVVPGLSPAEVSAWLSSRAASSVSRTPPAPQAGQEQQPGVKPLPA